MAARKAAPESLQFTSVLPGALFVMVVPFLNERLSLPVVRRGAAYSLVHDHVQRLDDVNVDVIVVVAKTSLRHGIVLDNIGRSGSGGSSDASDREYFADE